MKHIVMNHYKKNGIFHFSFILTLWGIASIRRLEKPPALAPHRIVKSAIALCYTAAEWSKAALTRQSYTIALS
jgi:hypothetical protein